MTTRARFFMIFATLAALVTSCAVNNERYCADDTDCLSLGQVCHNEGHFCHDACVNNDDCANPAWPGYMASRPYCDPSSGDCVASGADGGLPDAPAPTKQNGDGCGGDGECISGHCVGGVCCDKACDDDSSCAAGKVTGPTCVTGACQVVTNDCYGYACNTAGDACRVDCSDKTHCTGDFECVGKDCVNDLANGAFCGTNDKACTSGLCVDQVCCATDCSGVCEACNLTGTAGTCTPVAMGNDPDGECTGQSAACNGSCDGAGHCSFPGATTSCGALSCTAGSLVTPVCDGNGDCADQKTSCTPNICDSGGKACATGCADHTGCVSASACDRSGAHADPKGLGQCVDTGKIVLVGAGQEINDALAKVTASKPYVVIPPKTYTMKLSIGNVTAHLIGKGNAGNPVKLKPSVTGPAVSITDAATVSLQGLTLDAATGHGVQCSVVSAVSTLDIVESHVTNSTGIGVATAGCDITIRRSTLQGNDGGGAKLAGGAITLVNNLVTDNGKLNASPIGGLELTPKGTPKLHNNTIANNLAQSTKAPGAICLSPATFHSSILWGNIGQGQHVGCSFQYSDVKDGATGTTNLKVPPQFFDETKGNFSLKTSSPLIDNGGSSTNSSVDLANSPRLKGSAVDMGAYEVK